MMTMIISISPSTISTPLPGSAIRKDWDWNYWTSVEVLEVLAVLEVPEVLVMLVVRWL